MTVERIEAVEDEHILARYFSLYVLLAIPVFCI